MECVRVDHVNLVAVDLSKSMDIRNDTDVHRDLAIFAVGVNIIINTFAHSRYAVIIFLVFIRGWPKARVLVISRLGAEISRFLICDCRGYT